MSSQHSRRAFLTMALAAPALGIADNVAPAFLMIKTARSVSVFINGTQVGTLQSDVFTKFDVIPGDNLVRLVSDDGAMQWESVVHVPPGQQRILQPQLAYVDKTIGVPGTFVDPYDKQTYKTVTIGRKEWFAENYNADGYSKSVKAQSGRLYGPRGARAPQGWRLPRLADFEELIKLYADPFTELTTGKSGLAVQFVGETDGKKPERSGEAVSFWTQTSAGKKKTVSGHKVPAIYCMRFLKSQKLLRFESMYDEDFIKFSVRFVRDVRA